MDELISVIVPTYNSAQTINRCINSIRNQSYKNIEIIIVNDGSTDDTLYRLLNLADTDNRIKIYNIKNSGVSKARNIGIEKAKGEYVMFVDSDDYIEEKMVDKLLDMRKKYNMMPICKYSILTNGYTEETKEENVEVRVLELRKCFYELFFEQNALKAPWGKLYDLKIIKNNNIVFEKNLSLGEDIIFNLNYMKYEESICYSNERLYYYSRENIKSLSTRYYKNMINIQKKINKAILNYTALKACTEIDKIQIKCLKNLLTAVSNEFHSDENLFKRYVNARKIMKDSEIQKYANFLYKENKINKIFFSIIKNRMILTYLITKRKL